LPLKANLLVVIVLTWCILLPSTNLVAAVALGPGTQSWVKTFVVVPIDGIASRGVLGVANTQVNGSFTVRSCCGYSTNDIKFAIFNVDFSDSRDYGAVVDSLSFSWNTGTSEKYEMHFDNGWGQICDANGCHPDPLNPSSHNKTIELNMRETAPGLATLLPVQLSTVILGVAVMVGAGLVVSVIVILRETRRRKPSDP
jgi:hypothetical protein